ncbi:MAG: nucleotidyltransferase domain-containing protein [Nitrososphaeria archaeon]
MYILDSERVKVALDVCRRILDCGLVGLDAIILFGSVARGEDRRGSDIDLLLLYESEECALKAEDVTASIAAGVHGVNVSIVNKSYGELSSSLHFQFEVVRDGIVLYKRLSDVPLKSKIFPLSLYYVYVFDLSKLDCNVKNRVIVALYGRRKGKYVYRGLLEKWNGFRLGRGAIMVPAEAFRSVEDFFSRYDVSYRRVAVNLLFGDIG